MTLESLIAETATRGLRINNLFQLNDGSWRANTRSADPSAHCFEYGEGATPAAALRAALDKSKEEGIFG